MGNRDNQPESTDHFLKTAIKAAQISGAFLKENFGKLPPSAILEKQKNDFVTKIDQQSETLIVSYLQKHFPNHSILAEEGSNSNASQDFQWIIDPLDGTTNFIKEIPFFCVSIALKYQDDIIVGVIYNPMLDELFSAQKDGGAFLNNAPISVSTEKDFSRAFLATGFPHHAKRSLPLFINSFSEIFYKSAGVRRLGSAALDLCYTAKGTFEGFWELGLSPWDIAAGSLIASEAGATVTDFWNKPNYLSSGYILAATPSIYHQLNSILTFHFKE